MNDLEYIVSHFATVGTVGEIAPLGAGLINDSYKVTTVGNETPDYVLQRINHDIFTDVDMLQSNIEAVTRHIRHKLEMAHVTDIDRKVLHFLSVRDGVKT